MASKYRVTERGLKRFEKIVDSKVYDVLSLGRVLLRPTQYMILMYLGRDVSSASLEQIQKAVGQHYDTVFEDYTPDVRRSWPFYSEAKTALKELIRDGYVEEI